MKKYPGYTYTLFSLLLLLSVNPSFADMVYLKNGGSSEGIIEKVEDDKITLDVGYGKISLNKKDILRIDKYTEREQAKLKRNWSRDFFLRQDSIPQELKKLAQEFQDLEDLKDSAGSEKRARLKTEEEIVRLDKELKELKSRLSLASSGLASLKPQEDPPKYNSLVEQFNSLSAKIKLAEYNKEEKNKEINLLNENIANYINQLGVFRKKFKGIYSSLRETFTEEAKKVLEFLNGRLAAMEEDFTRHAINYRRLGSSIIVSAILNDSIRTNLVVDTGASLVTISRRIAEKLYLDLNQAPSTMVTLADGRNALAKITTIENIKVLDAEARNVQVAVLENQEAEKEDGLLGMSFLEKFMVKIDAQANRLILEEFNP
ncbi:MAG: retroviral-like aspartic protease family protein [Candidatus Omnitrophota bacterium]